MTALPLFLVLAALGVADEIQLLPAQVRLDGPHASQQFIVEATRDGLLIGDRTETATFSVDNPAVASVSKEGRVTPGGDGRATLTATVDGKTATASISVENRKKPESWSFKNHVLPVMTRSGCNQGSCHGAAAGKNGFRLTLRGYGPEVDYDVLSRQAVARRINKTSPSESLFLLKPTGAIEHGGGIRFTTDSPEYKVLAEWIADGMPRPDDLDPKLVKVESSPEAVRLEPGQTQRILVKATYSNGRVDDVTRWAKFGSTDETVAKVDEHGKIKVEGRGEAAITVWFSSLVDLTTITVPYASPDAKIYRDAKRTGKLDELNLAKLQALGIPPSPDCDDATFLRRAYLDATGTLPSLEVVNSYLNDNDPAKRSKLVDKLLSSDAYIDYWAYKWSDLFLVSSRKLTAPAMWSFYRFVRDSVAKNVSWDTFCRQIVTAKGATLTNGAANYFVLHRDPIDLTESASMAFLGLSLTCARCHNHPMEKWTQDQYYGVANLFSRVKLKDGETAGDVVVSAVADGNIRHPRTGKVMLPQPLDDRAMKLDDRTDRREAFADWLSKESNPYFAKAVVNRVWSNFFGRGLVHPEDDQRATNPASDSALMDWLVAEFRAQKYDMKWLIRTIMNSAMYARSSTTLPSNALDQKFLSHYPLKRLPAEVLLDAISSVTEVSTNFPGYPNGWRSLQLPDSKIDNSFLTSFGRADRISTCSCERSAEPSVSQALHLANGTTVNEKLKAENSIVAKLARELKDDKAVIDRLFKSALSRPPTEAELATFLPELAASTDGLTDPKAIQDARRQAMEDLYWAVLTGKEFLFNH